MSPHFRVTKQHWRLFEEPWELQKRQLFCEDWNFRLCSSIPFLILRLTRLEQHLRVYVLWIIGKTVHIGCAVYCFRTCRIELPFILLFENFLENHTLSFYYTYTLFQLFVAPVFPFALLGTTRLIWRNALWNCR